MDIDTKSNIKSLAINKEFERAIALKDKIEALQILRILVLRQDDTDIAPVEIKEKAIEKIASLYLQTKNEKKLPSILKDFSQFFASVSKAKTAKIVRNLLNTISKNSENAEMQLSFCDESIKWCQREKRSFLRQKIEARKAELLLEGRRYRDALAILRRLTSEAKQVDDKLYLIEVSLLDSQAHSV
ncbi:26S proteasome non-ATPase regulatory subunit 11, partial [Bonamia ostreae]